MKMGTPSFTQDTIVAGEPVETQVRVWTSSSYVRLVMIGDAGWKSAIIILCANAYHHLLVCLDCHVCLHKTRSEQFIVMLNIQSIGRPLIGQY